MTNQKTITTALNFKEGLATPADHAASQVPSGGNCSCNHSSASSERASVQASGGNCSCNHSSKGDQT